VVRLCRCDDLLVARDLFQSLASEEATVYMPAATFNGDERQKHLRKKAKDIIERIGTKLFYLKLRLGKQDLKDANR
jgi:hypothetical protein